MEGTKITKQECESMLYDEFDKFTSEHEESIHSYCMRYAKLVNDMHMIPMSMLNMQINKKFVNHLQPEWSRVKDYERFKDTMLLAQAQEARVVLNDEQQDFLTDSLEETNDCEDLQLQGEMQENDKKQGKKGSKCSILINRGIIQAIPISLPPQPIGEATKASSLQRNIMNGVDIEDLTTEQYLELKKDNHTPNVVDVPTRYRGHLSPHHKSPDPPLDAKTNPYFQASLSPIHLKITKTPSQHTKENEVIKEREQSVQGLAQIDQLRRQEHEVSECKMVHTSKNDAHQKETSQIERISSQPEKPKPGSFTIPCSVDIFNINAIADLGASVNIMSKPVLEELIQADPKNANIIVEMAE
ncbi:hypothetical protein Tco_0603310 [Tanacetum coccineum]